MSRSYKKTASESSGNGVSKYMKRKANKVVRHTKNIQNGSGYKKCFCSYDICDWKFRVWSPLSLRNWGDTDEELRESYKKSKRK